ncbi:MAG: hypothetical protein U0625_00150 [Phycisphaerales bacterium]
MANGFGIPADVEQRLRARFPVCAYCGGIMELLPHARGCPPTKASIEHLNRHGPFYWSKGLREHELVMACGSCNSSHGKKRLIDWFAIEYCRTRGITAETVHEHVREYLKTEQSLL